ncbi:DUF892 family protein [Granulicella arctica]|uniref:DUF892 family protein n=1 Tax=Granulicella arctica TaxID=940613 RepID=UPI0021E0961D|nr:DUF892 family protein [Granulicella arctica]
MATTTRRTLVDLLGNELQELLAAEKAILKVLPRLGKAAHTGELRETLTARVREGKEQVARLEKVVKILDLEGVRVCAGTSGILKGCSQVLTAYEAGNLRDVAILSGMERVEAYRVAAYGSCREIAELLGLDEVVGLVEEGLELDVLAGKKFAQIAVQVNAEAFVDGNSPDCFLKNHND